MSTKDHVISMPTFKRIEADKVKRSALWREFRTAFSATEEAGGRMRFVGRTHDNQTAEVWFMARGYSTQAVKHSGYTAIRSEGHDAP